jgi:transposase
LVDTLRLGTIESQKGAHQMPRTRPPYPPEFRAEAVKLARSSEKPLSELARDLGVSTETLRNWTKQQRIDTGKRDGLTTDEREELKRLRKENKILKEEREILRKATAFFAAEEKNNRRPR